MDNEELSSEIKKSIIDVKEAHYTKYENSTTISGHDKPSGANLLIEKLK
jgi:hypothetical protein